MDEIKADIIDYLGKYEGGVLVLLNLNYQDRTYEGTIYYSDKVLALTISQDLEKKLGTQVEFYSGYKDLVISILKRVVPYNEIINRLDEVNFSEYFTQDNSVQGQGENVDEDDIETQE